MGIEGIEQRAQHTALWRASAEAESCGNMRAHSNPLRAVTQEVLYPKAGGVWESQVQQFGHQSVREDGIKRRAVVYEKQSCVAPILLQMCQRGVEDCGNGVLCGPVRPVRILMGVKGGREKRCNVTPNQFLKTLHHHRGECHWPVVIESSDGCFFWQRDYS